MLNDILDMSSSIYSPLQFPDEIRLLILQPSRSGVDSPPTWQMKHARLSENPQYEALSYVWDQVPCEEQRSIASEEGLATNLSRALKHLRRVDEPDGRVLWIDALCVNQNDIAERNHQVTQMGEIYSHAESVIVWLGVGNSGTGTAVGKLSTQSDTTYTYYKPSDVSPWTHLTILMAIRALCRQKYWTRLWIIQEVLLAANIELHWGKEVCQWSQLCWILESIDIDWLEDVDFLHDLKISMIEEIRASTAARLCSDWVERQARKSNTMDASKLAFRPLIELCSTYGDASCVDTRDKVFGLHSLAESCCRAEVPVDYGLKLHEIHSRVLEHCMTRHERWDSIIGASQDFHKQLKIPLSEYLSPTGRPLRVSYSYASAQAVGYTTSTLVFLSARDLKGPESFKPFFVSRECKQNLSKVREMRASHGVAKFQKDFVTRHFGLAATVSLEQYRHLSDKILREPSASARLSKRDISWIVEDARAVTAGTPMIHTSIAICSSGEIYFVPSIARPGDLFCEMPASDIILVVRKSPYDGHDLVGRAILFLGEPLNKPSKFSFSIMAMRQMKESGREVTLTLDLHALQVMTAWSAK